MAYASHNGSDPSSGATVHGLYKPLWVDNELYCIWSMLDNELCCIWSMLSKMCPMVLFVCNQTFENRISYGHKITSVQNVITLQGLKGRGTGHLTRGSNLLPHVWWCPWFLEFQFHYHCAPSILTTWSWFCKQKQHGNNVALQDRWMLYYYFIV